MRYPSTQRAIVEVIDDEMKRQGITPAEMNRRLRTNAQSMGRILKLEQDLPTTWFVLVAQILGKRPSTLMARVERRLKAG